MKVVVLGCSGMAGHVIFNMLSKEDYDVFGMSRTVMDTKRTKKIDACDLSKLDMWLDRIRPDIVVNCIGILNEHAETYPDKAIMLNAYLPQWLARKYESNSTKIIHLSTDCVFSGMKGHYKEEDFKDGNTIYDRSKALGEINNSKDLTFRMSIIGPDRNPKGIGLFNWFMKQEGKINGYSKVIWNGITTIALAQAINQAIKNSLTGLYHLVPDSFISKYELLCIFKDVFHREDITIQKDDIVKKDKTLLDTRKSFSYTLKTYPEMVREMKDWIEEHEVLYVNNPFYKN